MPGSTSINGVISGLNTDDIISKLMELERTPIVRLQAKQASLNTKITAWQDANTRILAVKTKADALSLKATFMAKSFTSSDESIVKGTVTTSAQAGTYYVKVNAVARCEQQKSIGFADTDTTRVGTGTLNITVGSGATTAITLTDANNTLDGLRDAINRSGAGVTATIISDGSATAPNRLIVTSNTMGEAGAITIDTNGLTGGTDPGFTILQAAQDASITLGEGEGALTVTRSTNDVTGLIAGVTLNLRGADANKTIEITIKNDTEKIKLAIKDFADQYNNLMDFVGQQFKYDIATNTGGVLFSDPDLQMIHSNIISKLFSQVQGLSQTIQTLSQIGVTATTSDNRLTINEDKLSEMLATDLDSISRLFSTTGEASDPAVSFIASTDKTVVPGEGGYAVAITAAATKAQYTVAATQTANLTQDETLTINGATIQLTAGMTPAEVVAAINSRSADTRVTASRVNDYLVLTSTAWGSGRSITASSDVLGGGTGVGAEGSGTGTDGVDVAGTINGEAATGKGQVLTGSAGNDYTEGLQIKITATAPGSYGTVSFTKGLATTLSEYLGYITTPGTGIIKNAQNSLQTEIKDVADYIATLEERIAAKQDQLSMKFAAMESALAKLKGEGDYIASQIQGLSKIK